MHRRNFLKFGIACSGSVLMADDVKKAKNSQSEKMMSIIDLDLCDGCKGESVPKCVSACKLKNASRFPEPKHPIMDYWPQTKHEDYSNKRELITRLTPYNFTFVERVKVGDKEVSVPRRCMHCDNPPCQKICPFGVISKSPEGAVDIDEEFCLGGAKCRAVCPWGIPQRQGGVGIYLKLAPKFAGGGSMYKCDMCKDLLAVGQKPACEVACPKNAIKFGKKSEIMALLKDEKREIYGLNENGGTATVYVSSVKFEDIDKAIEQKHKGKPRMGLPHMKRVDSPMKESENLAAATLIAPFAAVVGAGIMAYKNSRKMKFSTKNEGSQK
ncbi:MAG: 4Fe-4S dicluster domain-containing protein [Campylobacter sp.]|nr:4Fe-4S dicluster domain-containing protein [Campylobacter sp.]